MPRRSGEATEAGGCGPTYTYTPDGKLATRTWARGVTTSYAYTYGYLPGSDLVATMANSHGHTATRTYDPVLPHITRVHNGFTGGRTISQYDYTYDSLGRRTAIANSGEAFTFSNANDLAAFNLYGYNTRSEVTSAARYWGTDTGDTSDAVDGQQYAYAFDPIGNRITAAEGDTSRTATYTANELNQYSQRAVPGVKELAGTAATDATVTVNDLPTDRYGPWWRHAFAVDNASSAAYTQAVVTAVYNPPGTNDPDVVSSSTGHVFVAQTPEAFQYDSDGNLAQDGRFTYTWDAENRLVSVTTRDDLPASVPCVRVEYAYDHQSRRIASATAVRTNAVWQTAESRAFLYDCWNVIQESINHQQPTTNYYTWGLDLSGSLQGAGGIGGLLTTSLDGTTALYCYDANGNVGQLVSTDGELLAHYEYSPFGETIVSTGVDATDNPFRFSTKWFDDYTGLGYWGYRWYGPGMGRWLSRDPIRESGGLNLYAYVANSPISLFDYLGLKCVVFVTPTSGGDEKEVSAANDVGVFKIKQIGLNGDFHDNDFDVDFSWWHGHCLKIKFIVKIHINEDLVSKTTHASGEYVGYSKHFVSGTDIKGGSSRNPVYGEVLVHEQGHAKAYFEVLKPKLEQEFEPYCNDAKYSKPEQKEALKQQIKTKLDALRKDATYLQKTAEYPNTASIGYYSNGQYTPVTPPVYPSPPGLEDIIPPAAMDYVWQKK